MTWMHSTGIYLFKRNNGNMRTMCEICSKLTIKTPERLHRRPGVFLLTLNIFASLFWCFKCWFWASRNRVALKTLLYQSGIAQIILLENGFLCTSISMFMFTFGKSFYNLSIQIFYSQGCTQWDMNTKLPFILEDSFSGFIRIFLTGIKRDHSSYPNPILFWQPCMNHIFLKIE